MRRELGADAKAVLERRAVILRARLLEAAPRRLSALSISLKPKDAQTLLAFYEAGHIIGVRYTMPRLPDERTLRDDLLSMLDLYAMATALGGTQELDTTGHAVPDHTDEDIPEVSLEERRRRQYHFRLERNQRLAELAKTTHGYRCQVCGFSFEREYGQLGRGYIEAHHLTPLSELTQDSPPRLSPRDDFAVVCANCHRMIHRKGAPASFSAFRATYPMPR